jgi:hypothetical protein
MQAPAPAAPAKGNTKLAAATPAQAAPQPQADAGQSDGFFSSLARKVGFGGATADTTASTTPPPASDAKSKTAAKPLPKAVKPTETKTAESKRPPLKPSVTDTSATASAAPAAAPQQSNLVAGGTPIVNPNSFDNRFSAAK